MRISSSSSLDHGTINSIPSPGAASRSPEFIKASSAIVTGRLSPLNTTLRKLDILPKEFARRYRAVDGISTSVKAQLSKT